MSTSKTQKYSLHAWKPEDNFLLSEINENFAKLDGAARGAAGVYTGDGAASQVIRLGFTPAAVVVMPTNGKTYGSDGYVTGGLAVTGAPLAASPSTTRTDIAVEVVSGGFRVHQAGYASLNVKDRKHHYVALA